MIAVSIYNLSFLSVVIIPVYFVLRDVSSFAAWLIKVHLGQRDMYSGHLALVIAISLLIFTDLGHYVRLLRYAMASVCSQDLGSIPYRQASRKCVGASYGLHGPVTECSHVSFNFLLAGLGYTYERDIYRSSGAMSDSRSYDAGN